MINFSKNDLTPKNFARMFVHTRNAGETARRLGAPADEAVCQGEKMLSSRSVQREIRRLDSQDPQTLCYVKTGLSRLAFGAINDAALLIFDENITPEKIMKADLFNVSEIKKDKGGGVEIKFWDRQKALEKLVELDPELREVSAADKFIQAVYAGSEEMPSFENFENSENEEKEEENDE